MTIERYDRSRRRTYRGDAVIAWVKLQNRRAVRTARRARMIGNPARPRTLLLLMAVVFAGALVWLG